MSLWPTIKLKYSFETLETIATLVVPLVQPRYAQFDICCKPTPLAFRPQKMTIVLVLDIDETLVHTTATCDIQGCDHSIIRFEAVGTQCTYFVHKRDHFDAFRATLAAIRAARKDIEVVVFTAGSRSYAYAVVPLLFDSKDRIRLIFHGGYLTYSSGSSMGIKCISTVAKSYDGRARFVTLDDMPHHYPDATDRDVTCTVPCWTVDRKNTDYALLHFIGEFSKMIGACKPISDGPGSPVSSGNWGRLVDPVLNY